MSKVPTLILVTGLPATGKTTLSRKISQELKLPLFSKDEFKELLYDCDSYSNKNEQERLTIFGKSSFQIVQLVIKNLLLSKVSCVIDANFDRKFIGDFLNTLKAHHNIHFLLIEINMRCDGDVLLQRFKNRTNRHKVHNTNLYLQSIEETLFTGHFERIDFPSNYIEIDTTDFNHIDNHLIQKLKSYL